MKPTKEQMYEAFNRFGAGWDFRKNPRFRCFVPTQTVSEGYLEAMNRDWSKPIESNIMSVSLEIERHLYTGAKVIRLIGQMEPDGEPTELFREIV